MKIKKLLSFVLVFVLILTCTFALSGCKSANEDLQIDSHRVHKVSDDKYVIVIKFHFKNNTGYETSLTDEYSISLYQDNIALDEYYIEYYDEEKDEPIADFEYKEESEWKYIRDGGEYYPEMAFYLEDAVSDVEVEILPNSLFGKSTTKIIKLK